MSKKPLIDKNGEVRELTNDDLKGFKPAKEILPPEFFESIKTLRGRPKLDNPKQHIGMRLDADIVAWLRSQKGYNAVANAALRDIMENRT